MAALTTLLKFIAPVPILVELMHHESSPTRDLIPNLKRRGVLRRPGARRVDRVARRAVHAVLGLVAIERLGVPLLVWWHSRVLQQGLRLG